jgi:hypothetical protein
MSLPTRTADIFPANVHITPSDTYPGVALADVGWKRESALPGSQFCNLARVIASNGVLYIGVDSGTGPVPFLREEFIIQEKDESKITRFVTVTNKIIIVNRDTSCGCGSRLKNWSISSSISMA